VVSRERIARTAEDLQTTEWEGVTWALSRRDPWEDSYYFLDVIKRSSPLIFDVAAREWDESLDLLGVILEVATKCGLPRMA
jgi:hypothetical protein